MKPKELQNLTDEQLIKEFEEAKKNQKSKKYLMLIAATLSILLMISYIYISFPVFGIISGQIESQKINDNVISSRGINIIFQNNTELEVLKTYQENPNVETSLCMIGEIIQNNYYIQQVYQPIIYSQSFRHVTHAPCSQETIAMFHTHPYKSCLASRQDIRTLRQNQQNKPELIMIIMCEPDRFSIYK